MKKDGSSIRAMLTSRAFFLPTVSPILPITIPPKGLIKNAAPNTAKFLKPRQRLVN